VFGAAGPRLCETSASVDGRHRERRGNRSRASRLLCRHVYSSALRFTFSIGQVSQICS